ncbi:MAG: cytochrome c biogenesis protein ResB [Deltaproteobacteria bacterium]|nr:cytochrome c biogenesis protein ResB [Deltaproteobacteria bacterium]
MDKKRVALRQVDVLVKFFSSTSLGIFLVLMLAGLSMVGTLVSPVALQAPEGFWGNLAYALNLHDIYHSFLFFVVALLFLVNLILCSLKRLPLAIANYRKKIDTANMGMPPMETVFVDGLSTEIANQRLAKVAKRFERQAGPSQQQAQLFAFDKGRISYLGVYIVHLAVAILTIGAVVSALWGISGQVKIAEGQEVSEVRLSNGTVHDLGFFVRCDKFTVDFYDDQRPKTYRSDVVFTKGNETLAAAIRVNHPAIFGDYSFYQASFGVEEGKAIFTIKDGKGLKKQLKMQEGDVVRFDDNLSITVVRVEANMMNAGPAVNMVLEPKGKHPQTLWLFQNIKEIARDNPGIIERFPAFNPQVLGFYSFDLLGLEDNFYTVLEMRNDPAIAIVAMGGLLLVAGLILVFYYSHRRVWITIEAVNAGISFAIAAKSNKDTIGMTREIELIKDIIRGKQ